ncbi:unnamed protein product [Penicillium roqueforti FM164]|uniref:Genomic scaffold, ProqFM164S01 n=1 Tax=Penicillium roqueforti (strain FM164) TaxID=1365484 RepID=W6PVT5_PENRF|nr:unnamed protein product [Penicillium roqueforti FM164]
MLMRQVWEVRRRECKCKVGGRLWCDRKSVPPVRAEGKKRPRSKIQSNDPGAKVGKWRLDGARVTRRVNRN